MSPVARKAFRIVRYIVLSVAVLLSLVLIMINLPVVHVLIIKKVNAWLQEKSYPVSVGSISITLNGNLELNEIKIIPNKNDTIIYAGNIKASFNVFPLFFKRIIVQNINLENGVVNLHTDSTGKLNLLSIFNATPKDTVEKTSQGSSWEIQVDEVHLQNIRFHYSDAAKGILIEQSLQQADIAFDKFSLLKKQIDINTLAIAKAKGSATITASQKDTVSSDSPIQPWKFSARDIQLTDVSYYYSDPASQQLISIELKKLQLCVDKLYLLEQEIIASKLSLDEPMLLFRPAQIQKISPDTSETGATISLGSSWLISCKVLDIKNGTFEIDTGLTSTNGSLAEWLPVRNINTSIKDAVFGPNKLGCDINKLTCALNEKLILHAANAQVESDSLLRGKVSIELMASMTSKEHSISMTDTFEFATILSGSPEKLLIEKLDASTHSGTRLVISGSVSDVLDIPESGIELTVQTSPVSKSQATNLLSLFNQHLTLPEFSPVTLSGAIGNTIYSPQFKINANSGSGNIVLAGNYNSKNKYATLDATLSDIKTKSLFGDDYPETISCQLLWNGTVGGMNDLNGKGAVHINNLIYQDINTRDLNLEFDVAQNKGVFTIRAMDSTLACELNGEIKWKQDAYDGFIEGMISINDSEKEWVPGNVAVRSKLSGSFLYTSQTTDASLDLIDLNVRSSQNSFYYDSLTWDMTMTSNSMKSQLMSDFIQADFNCHDSFEKFISGINNIGFNKLFRLDTANFINAANIVALPPFDMSVHAKYDSLYGLFIPDSLFRFNAATLNIDKVADDNKVTLEFLVDSVRYEKYKSYGVNLAMVADDKILNSTLRFDSLNVNGSTTGVSEFKVGIVPEKITASVLISDSSSAPVYQLGIAVVKANNRILFQSTEPEWILKSDKWTLSSPEFLSWEIATRDFIASTKLNHQEMRIELNGRSSDSLKLELEKVRISTLVPRNIISNAPDGILNASIVYSNQSGQHVGFKFEVDSFKWKDLIVDKIETNGFYNEELSRSVNSELTALINDSSRFQMKLSQADSLSARSIETTFHNVPVNLIEPFTKDYLSNMQGYASGDFQLNANKQKPIFNGNVRLKTITLNIVPLQAWFTIPDDSITIKSNQVNFNNFVVLDSLQKKLNVNGTISLENTDNITSDLRVTLDDVRVMNTTVKDNPDFFGAIIVNSGLHITGPLTKPSVKGNITLEEGTNITYRQINDVSVQETQQVVTFASLSGDTLVNVMPLSGVSSISGVPAIQTTIEINPQSKFNFEISSGYDINIGISGNGLLNYAMLPNNSMSLTGNYEIKEGTAELKFPGWPKKYFTITKGSFLRWAGRVDDPEINLEATSKVEGSYVNPVDNKTRYVDFIVSMKLSEQLSQLNVVFGVKSSDQYIMSVLNALSEDERMRQAINLLIFESINLPNIESSSNYLDSQINSFWETQLNSITKTNFKKVELSFGIDSYTQTSATGVEEDKTSLSYEMERKFLDDRASVKISGRFNDGSEAGNTANSMLENFIIEYELDTMERKFLKLYTRKDYEDILDGEVTKSGVGFIYRKSYPDFKSIWRRMKKTPAEQKTSTIE